jgi:hypothetical protein
VRHLQHEHGSNIMWTFDVLTPYWPEHERERIKHGVDLWWHLIVSNVCLYEILTLRG